MNCEELRDEVLSIPLLKIRYTKIVLNFFLQVYLEPSRGRFLSFFESYSCCLIHFLVFSNCFFHS